VTAKKTADYKRRFKIVGYNKKWGPIIVKQTISRRLKRKWPQWKFLDFYGKHGAESRGIVDLLAIRKDHRLPKLKGTKRGDTFQIILIQVKSGQAARPTEEDSNRLRAVARHHGAHQVLLATWKQGKAATFEFLSPNGTWSVIADLNKIFE
jgi:hypothetical protein